MIYLNIDKNNYLLSVATVGSGIEADIDLTAFDLTGDRILAHKWDGATLVFDAERLEEIENEPPVIIPAEPTGETSVYDELAAAYKEGVQGA